MRNWLRKWWLLLLASLVGFVLLVWNWTSEQASAPYSVGAPLPQGVAKPQLLVHYDFLVLLAPDGILWAWGGEVARPCRYIFGTPVAPTTPLRIGTESDWRRVATTGRGILAIKADGSLWALGLDAHGVLQAPRPSLFGTLFRIGTDSDWADVSADDSHALAMKRNGTLCSWGANDFGQVGNGAVGGGVVTNCAPVWLEQTNWQSIATGQQKSYAIQRDGTLWSWGISGYPNSGFTSAPTPVRMSYATNWSSVSARYRCAVAVRTDGTLWAFGEFGNDPAFESFTQLDLATDWEEAVCGYKQLFARKRDGTWWALGWGTLGQFGDGKKDNLSRLSKLSFPLKAQALAAGHTVAALSPDGRLWTWGQRPGVAPRFALFVERIDAVNKLVIMLGKEEWLHLKDYPCDLGPRLAWELPPSVKAALGTNASSQPKPAP